MPEHMTPQLTPSGHGEDYDRWQAEYVAKQDAARAAREQRQQERFAFWRSVYASPVTALQQLYDAVIAHSEKRMPKWRFRPQVDLVVEIQPKLTRHNRLYRVAVFEQEAVTLTSFKQPRDKESGIAWIEIKGSLIEASTGQLGFRPTSLRGEQEPRAWVDGIRLKQRLIDVLQGGFFDEFRPSHMLAPYCFCCGRELTDPASMARFIGPECYGSGAISVPWLYSGKEAAG
jgi:hypothetical protein